MILNISAAKMPELLICDGFHDVNCECEQYALLLNANLINIIIWWIALLWNHVTLKY